ncbi:MAG: orotate phosphoribosyltransferase [Bdellovibrionales bacterium]|nr:orotate phosphoribosyltransferase [Bdellovibrionales bacterium]
MTPLAQKIFKACHLTGNFKLRSGLNSTEYFDKYAMEADPQLLKEVTDQLLPLIPKNIDLLAGLEMGGIPLTTSLSLKSGYPCRFIRKKAKDYGTMRLCEGGEIKGKKLCLIEDVITTGGQVIQSCQDLRALGAQVIHVLCVIFRGKNFKRFEKENLKLTYLFSLDSFKTSN